MTLDLQAALPEELALKVTVAAAERGLPLRDFLSLLIGLWTLPQMRLLEDWAVRDLSDELMLHFQKCAVRIARKSGAVFPDIDSEGNFLAD